MEIFEFKKYKIKQNAASVFKVNTEAVLLCAWVNVNDCASVLEIGSGTGVIALGLRQRLNENSMITTIDIDLNAFELTQTNIELNQIRNITAHHISLQEFYEQNRIEQFDLIVSNPPYFDTALKSLKPRNIYAKYTDNLSYETLVKMSAQLMKRNGRIALVIPYSDTHRLTQILKCHQLSISRQLNIQTIPRKPPLRVLIEICRQTIDSPQFEEKELTIKNDLGQFTNDYMQLTKDFYTKF